MMINKVRVAKEWGGGRLNLKTHICNRELLPFTQSTQKNHFPPDKKKLPNKMKKKKRKKTKRRTLNWNIFISKWIIYWINSISTRRHTRVCVCLYFISTIHISQYACSMFSSKRKQLYWMDAVNCELWMRADSGIGMILKMFMLCSCVSGCAHAHLPILCVIHCEYIFVMLRFPHPLSSISSEMIYCVRFYVMLQFSLPHTFKSQQNIKCIEWFRSSTPLLSFFFAEGLR